MHSKQGQTALKNPKKDQEIIFFFSFFKIADYEVSVNPTCSQFPVGMLWPARRHSATCPQGGGVGGVSLGNQRLCSHCRRIRFKSHSFRSRHSWWISIKLPRYLNKTALCNNCVFSIVNPLFSIIFFEPNLFLGKPIEIGCLICYEFLRADWFTALATYQYKYTVFVLMYASMPQVTPDGGLLP